MKRAPTFLISLCVAAGSATWPLAELSAQQTGAQKPRPVGVALDLKDGRQVLATGFRLSDNVLMATQQVGDGTGEIGYPLNTVDRVEFPNPPPLATARAELAQCNYDAALKQIDPIASYYFPLRNVPGNWWLPSVLVKLDALAGLRHEGDFNSLLAELGRVTNNPAAEEAFRLRTAEDLMRHNHLDKAEPALDALLKTSANEDVLARAWVGKGLVLSDRRDYDAAALAYLHVPVFYPDDRRQMPVALLGSGKALGRLDQREKAQDAFQQIITEYPSAPEAKEAKVELQRLSTGKPNS